MKFLGLLIALIISANSYAGDLCGSVVGANSNALDESITFSLLLTNVLDKRSSLKPNKVVMFETQNKSEIAIVLKAFKLSNVEVCLYGLSRNGERGNLIDPITFSSMRLQ